MSDAHPAIREHAVRIAEERAARSDSLRSKLIELAGDDDPRVRMQVAFSLGAISDRVDAQTALARILERDAASPADAKLRSIRLLRHAPPGRADDILDPLINASQPPEVQLASVQALAAPRRQVIDDYQAALKLAGDPRRGSAVFAKHCATCHRLNGVGKAIGPDLVGVRSKTPDAILTSILDPSREVAASYLNYVVVTKDGRVATGLLIGESPTAITLRRAEAAEDIVPRADIEELTSTGKSLMPEGMEQQIDHQSMADLIQFLMTDQAP